MMTARLHQQKITRERSLDYLPIAASTVPRSASHMVLGALFSVTVEPRSLTRMMATTMHTQPIQKRAHIPIFCPRGICNLQIRPKGNSMTDWRSVTVIETGFGGWTH